MSLDFARLLRGVCLLAPLAIFAVDAPLLADPPRPNILWIVSDDLSPDLGCYGESAVRTPNLDRLASQGIRYNAAFTTAPVCSASRSAFFTGMYQTTIGAHNHRSHRGDGFRLPKGISMLMDYFRSGGYYTVSLASSELGTNGKTDYNFATDKLFDGNDWNQRGEGQPFFAYANIKEPHRGFVKPEDVEHPVDPARVKLPPYYPDHPLVRQDWAAYFNTVQVLDEKVGRVLQRLQDDDLAENTVVIFFGDHGRPHVRGKQFLYDEGIRVPLLVRWPANPQLVKPGKVSDELVSAIDFAPTSLWLAGIDPPDHMQGQVFLGPEAGQRQFIFAARDRCDGTVDRIRCVRDKRIKYIRNFMPDRPYTQLNAYKESSYPVLGLMRELNAQGKLTAEQAPFMADVRPDEELYDLAADPHEVHNLALDPEHRQTLQKYRAKLQRWIEQTDDQGRFPEDPAVVKREYDGMKQRHEEALKGKARGLQPPGSAGR